jgi:acyl-CoA reductase-like NAD-dependent aldehyde dehydrogenase
MSRATKASSGGTFQVRSPFDGKLIKALKRPTLREAMKMLDTAERLFKNRDKWLEHSERVAVLNKLAVLVAADAEKFALLIAQEGGKPLTDARVEVARAIDGIKLAAKEILHVVKGEEIPMGFTAASHGRMAWTSKEPIGIVVAVSAFNHPLNLIVHQAVPAIAVGCPVIVKPAGTTPLNAIVLAKLAEQAGLPKDWFQVCPCDSGTAEKLVTDSRVGFFSFIGSGRVGWMLRSKLAPGVRCALEHGGVAPVIVDENVDLKSIVPPLVKGGFYHAGQVCVSVQRIFAPEKTAAALARELAQAARKLTVGDPTSAKTDVGPLITNGEVDRVHQWVTEAVKKGAKLLCGGKKLSKSTYAPTVLLNPPKKATVSTSEVFGPVVCVYGYKNRLKAIDEANSLDVAFQAAVFSNDLCVALDTVKRLDATAVMVNDHTAFRVDWMPFGGRRASGLGMGGIGYTMHDMLQDKMMVLRT